MARRLWRYGLSLVLALALSGGALYAERPSDDVDPLALAALLISDGRWDKAAAALAEVNPDDKHLDRARYYTQLGLIARHEERWAEAATLLSRAIAEGATDPNLRLMLAQAELKADAPKKALQALDADRAALDPLGASWLLRAQAHRALGDTDGAWAALTDGANAVPDDLRLAEQQVLLLIELGLSQEALARAQLLLRAEGAGAERWILLSEALRGGGQDVRAAALLEEARLRFPEDERVPLALAKTYLALDQPLSAGLVLQSAATRRPELAVEAAECFRRAGQLDRAIRQNGEVPDGPTKTRQRLGLLLEAEDFERAAALTPRATRLGLVEEDEVAYGLAYAWMRLGEAQQAEALLKHIEDPKVFQRATQLRAALAACAAEGTCG
ncbi:hypothetical protein L6R49_14230 [Myxococcota bacterium]|nr:hypothetical protein [Myxococcota bacterium]